MRDFNYPKVYLYRRIVRAKLFIDEHFHEPLDLNNISGEAFFSRFHFLRLFKRVYGKTPHQYLTSVRLRKSKELLRMGDISAAEVCFEVGFQSISSFHSLFKRHTGFTPSDFQRRELKKINESSVLPHRFIPSCFIVATSR